ncbi:MAG: DNA polymerase IV [Actinobacteria bacterium]|jgi:DNA polymerase-4|nr:DNA polymerase IV [Actinomycetota bacterium]NCW42754.1 DNA polymerase IV [Actinomycetota bacterium]NCW72044.1 DNA polymerase IV [Actinomycetota bacterium]NCX15726.1 DNA polymerase IV [Actinomycetota bacterium]NCX37985.1 DNA polymerase IV [Actinomycetota bacterium]
MSEEIAKQATILHVDMDAFFASVAERDNPELKGKAVVIGMGARGVVSAANYEARKFGIHSAMPVGRARRLAPHAIFLPVDMARYQEVSGHVMEIFQSFTPWVEPISLDEAFLDVTGSQKLLGSGREIAVAIRKKVEEQEGITCSVGIAPSKFIAKLASANCKPNGMLEITADRILTFLHPLPIQAMWGVGPKTAEVLERLGLRTIEDIAKLPRATLIRALGEANGASLYELAWGRDYRDVTPDEPDRSISAAETFAQDLDNPEEILTEFLRLTERATARLRDRDLFAKTISIKVRFADFSTINRSKTLPLPIDSTHDVYEVVKGLYQALRIERARLRLVGVALENLSQAAPHQMMLGEREVGWRQAEGAIDQARARFGKGSVRPARLISAGEDDED